MKLPPMPPMPNLPQLFPVGLTHYLILALLLFCIGLFTVLSRKHAVGILLGIELMLNAANINLVAFSYFLSPRGTAGMLICNTVLDGQVFALIVIALAACEAAVGLAIILRLYRNLGATNLDDVAKMKW
jgi:NADH:ubiquinone oxidoreductase subunit K